MATSLRTSRHGCSTSSTYHPTKNLGYGSAKTGLAMTCAMPQDYASSSRTTLKRTLNSWGPLRSSDGLNSDLASRIARVLRDERLVRFSGMRAGAIFPNTDE